MASTIQLHADTADGGYPVRVGRGVLAQLPDLLEQAGMRGRPRLVADERVLRLHERPLLAALEATKRDYRVRSISGLEVDKNLATVSSLFDWLIDVGTDRSDLVLACGGGVVGDLVGFVAATYLRGVRLVHLPSTLLAMVDSSIGGKTGVDHADGKNLIGAFHQPSVVVADLDFLTTLPRREVAAGWAEIVKMGVVRSRELFERIEANPASMMRLDPDAAWAIARAIALKAEIVAQDERESGLRMLLNYGHTIGHAIEAASGYARYLHGEAVAIGMHGAAAMARELGLWDSAAEARQAALLGRFGLPDHCTGLTVEQLWRPMQRDKKAVGSKLRWVLPTAIGSAGVYNDVPAELVAATLRQLIHD